MDPKVDRFLERAPRFRDEMTRLRRIALDCGLEEGLKWGKPCYGVQGGNVAILQPFKERCAFLFFKGALLDDPTGLLERPGPNSRAGRRMIFTSVAEVDQAEPQLRAFIKAAIGLEQAGAKVERTQTPHAIPEELEEIFQQVPGLKAAFEALTPGRQRAYLLHFGGAKQARTRTARIERCIARIRAGKGPNDRDTG